MVNCEMARTISSKTSPAENDSPSFFFHWAIPPSVMVGDMAGIANFEIALFVEDAWKASTIVSNVFERELKEHTSFTSEIASDMTRLHRRRCCQSWRIDFEWDGLCWGGIDAEKQSPFARLWTFPKIWKRKPNSKRTHLRFTTRCLPVLVYSLAPANK